jgi:hypothetical protein
LFKTPSAAALAFVVARVLASLARATEVANKAVARYAIAPDAIDLLTNAARDN